MTGFPASIVTGYVLIILYIGLAVHVVSRNPRRSISWIFAGFLLTIAVYYLMRLFLFPAGIETPETVPWAMRVQWAALSLFPAFFLHFNSFYFPAAIRKPTWRLIPVVYLLVIGLAFLVLFTDVYISEVLYNGPNQMLGIKPGPGMWLNVALSIFSIGFALFGLFQSYRVVPSRRQRQQITFLIVPLLLLVVSAGINWVNVLSGFNPTPLTEISDMLLIASGFFYAGIVVQYGSITGRPVAVRVAFYAVIGTLIGLFFLYVFLIIDLYLSRFFIILIPILSSILLTSYIASYPYLNQLIYDFFERIFHRLPGSKSPEVKPVSLGEVLDPTLLREELLAAMTNDLHVDGAFLAEIVSGEFVPEFDLAPGTLPAAAIPKRGPAMQIVAAFGRLSLAVGQRLPVPEPFSREVTPASALTAEAVEPHQWYGLAMYTHLNAPGAQDTLLAACSLNRPFTPNLHNREVFEAYARQMEIAQQIYFLDRKRQQALEQASSQAAEIRGLEERIQELAVEEVPQTTLQHTTTRLSIGLLGPMEVKIDGKLVPDSAWESERSRSLLAYLLWKGPVGATSAELLDKLWGEKADAVSYNALYVAITRLRRVLDPQLERPRESNYILSETGRYRFNFESDFTLDVIEFQQMANSNDINNLRQAVALYRGEYLEDATMSLPVDIETMRQNLERQYVSCLRRLIAQEHGRDDNLYLEKLLHVTSLDEEANLLLAERYLMQGRADLALNQMIEYRDLLVEYGEEPSEDFRQLWRRVEREYQNTIP